MDLSSRSSREHYSGILFRDLIENNWDKFPLLILTLHACVVHVSENDYLDHYECSISFG